MLVLLGIGCQKSAVQPAVTSSSNKPSSTSAQNSVPTDGGVAAKTAAQSAVQVAEQKKIIEEMQAVTAKDADFDGLSDVDERQKYHTDPNNADTDSDGLLDSDEINIYHTDPLKSDTDGDGHKDGQEVSSGYDPLGPGKRK